MIMEINIQYENRLNKDGHVIRFKNQRDHYEKILDDLQDRYDAKNEIEAKRMQRVSDTLDKINMTLNKIGEKQ